MPGTAVTQPNYADNGQTGSAYPTAIDAITQAMARIATAFNPHAVPAAAAAPVLSSSAGGALGARTYYSKITLVTPAGEVTPSAESNLALNANTLLNVASPTFALGVTGWNVYVSTATGTETKQNSTPIAIGTAWVEPTGGLISGAALPAGMSQMKVIVDAGVIPASGALATEVAAQLTAAITAPTTNPRKDIVYIDATTGATGIATGTEAASPSDPAVPAGKVAVARINCTVGMTAIANSALGDLRSSYVPMEVVSQTEAEAGIGTTPRRWTAQRVAQAIAALNTSTPRGYLDGCVLSTAGGSATMSISAGAAVESGNTSLMSLSAISKTTAAWAVGTAAGGLDTGTIANNTWYHFFVIKRTDTGVVDVLISLSATAPTMPSGYTLKRRIGSGKINGAGQWISFTQIGDVFDWTDPVVDVDAQNPGTAAVTRTLTVPTGVAVQAKVVMANHHGSTAQVGSYLSPLHATDTAPQANATVALGAPFTFLGTNSGTAAWVGGSIQEILTNTSAQIRSRLNVSGANERIGIITLGWIDARGRNA